jgi:phosphoglycerol transferase MdoB-like AlkP superfamily enzyme
MNRFHRAFATVLQPASHLAAAAPIKALRQRVGSVRPLIASKPLECWMALVLCIAPLTLRTLLLVEHSFKWGPADAHGYLSDLTMVAVVAVLLAAVMRILPAKARAWLGVLAVGAWTLLHGGNYEHVKALGAPLQFTYAQYMRDGVFVAGSAFSVSRLASILLLLVVGAVGTLLAAREATPPLSWQTRAVAVLTLMFANAAWPSDFRALAWRESDFMELLIVPSSAKASGVAQRAMLPESFRPNIVGDLNGAPTLPPATGRPNVLLVILEGITGGSLPSVAAAHGIKQAVDMPELSALAEKNTSYSTFLTNQRQTNRGEFALLCGHLDYLVSGTSRMTEYARTGGEACLPRVLAERGYRTMYVQPAPLSFMMKDQFMAKAGFTDVRGHDFFPQAYARSSWGVDDRAFFEQASTAITELNGSGSPWFAALLTVGTHHPYTVPDDFKTGNTALDEDPHARAVRYLDHAVTAFVSQLEASHVLDNTLLLITSDESFGVEGYDDLTQLLSYNWGFLIAKVPGQGKRVVTQPHAQTDVALSIADYLGLGAGPFVGRSLFRTYDEPRQIVFANTYQQKVYSTTASQIVECDEALSACQKHTITGPGLFSEQRVLQPASEADIAPLREMVALTNTHVDHGSVGRTPLILDNAAIWNMGPDSYGLVFAGQYFTLNADEEVAVSLEATPIGRGASLMLDADLYARGMLYEVLPPPVYDGDTLRFQYVYAPGRTQDNVEVRLSARTLNGSPGRLVLNKAEMVVRPRTLRSTGGVTTSLTVERSQRVQTYFIGSGLASDQLNHGLALNPCFIKRDGRELVGKACPRSVLVYGPYAKVAAHSDVRVTFELSSEAGSPNVRAEIISGMGQMLYAQSDVVSVKQGSGTTITLNARVDQAIEGLEARLGLINNNEDSALVIRRAVVEIFPPELKN